MRYFENQILFEVAIEEAKTLRSSALEGHAPCVLRG